MAIKSTNTGVTLTKEEFLTKAASLQQAHQLAMQMNMKVKAVFYENPASYGLDGMWEYV